VLAASQGTAHNLAVDQLNAFVWVGDEVGDGL
jgi:hypothetical protein